MLITNTFRNTHNLYQVKLTSSSRVSLRVKVIKGHFHFRGRKFPYSIYINKYLYIL